ncbi:MAG: response regulator transcription factor [Saprospiraceae bacterium]|nr:response regulator transcription factor [Saprospiraceae bacterium]
MTDQISIFIVDDHEILRDGIRAMLLGSGIKVIGDFAEPEELFERLENQQPTVMLLDISMPKMTGLEILEELQNRELELNVLMLSAETDEQKIQQAVKLGALGFLPKDCSRSELITAIKTVADQKNYFGSSILSIIFKSYVDTTRQEQQDTKLLSDREIEIVKMLCNGLSYKDIGRELFISHRTVESAKKVIFEKLSINNNMELLKTAIKMGIVSLE